MLPQVFGTTGGIVIGPILEGVPVNCWPTSSRCPKATIRSQIAEHTKKLLDLLDALRRDLGAAPPDATDEQLQARFAKLAKPMLALSKCPDFAVNRGHYFGYEPVHGRAARSPTTTSTR